MSWCRTAKLVRGVVSYFYLERKTRQIDQGCLFVFSDIFLGIIWTQPGEVELLGQSWVLGGSQKLPNLSWTRLKPELTPEEPHQPQTSSYTLCHSSQHLSSFSQFLIHLTVLSDNPHFLSYLWAFRRVSKSLLKSRCPQCSLLPCPCKSYVVLTKPSFRDFFPSLKPNWKKLMRNIRNYLMAVFILHISIPVQLCSAPKDFSCFDLYRYLGHKLCPAFAILSCEIHLFPGENDI